MSYTYLGLTVSMWQALRDARSHWRLCSFSDHALGTLEALERRGFVQVKLDGTGRYIWRGTAAGRRMVGIDYRLTNAFKEQGTPPTAFW